ncbi:hypothetical protein [Peribacillus asahii]
MGLILDEATNGLGIPSDFIENPILAEVERIRFHLVLLSKVNQNR